MNIPLVLFVALLPIVLSAPLAVEKRSKEVILFGNHQNKPRVAFTSKKSDPAFDANSDPGLIDQKGSIRVVDPVPESEPEQPVSEPVDLPDAATLVNDDDSTINDKPQLVDSAKDLEEVKSENPDDVKTMETAVENAASDVSEPTVESSATESSAAAEDSEASPVNSDDQISTDTEVSNDNQASSANNKELEDFYEYLLSYGADYQRPELPSHFQDYFPNLYSLRRKRNSQNSMIKRSHKTLKRARRIKRDLLDDQALYMDQYPVQERLPSDEELYEMFHSTAQNLQDLADLLDLYTEYQKPDTVTPPYVAYEPYETPSKEYKEEENELYSPENDEEIYSTVKREMLSDMPGLKKRLFYPTYEEPETHWGPFVTQQKRDEDNREESYRRLILLAQALAGDQPSSYYYDDYYKKK